MLSTGLRAWVVQRMSALYIALCLVWFVFHLWLDPPQHYQAWTQWLALPYVSVAIGIFFLSLMIHAWVGIRDVLMDYVSSLGLRSLLFIVVLFFLLAMGLWSMIILFSIEHR